LINSIQSNRSSLLNANASLNGNSGTGKATEDFAKLIELAMKKMQQGTNSRRKGDEPSPMQPPTPAPATTPAATTTAPNTTPTAGQVVLSPFNVLGLPISGTLAPTAAEVAANPAKYAGTSFDPNRQMEFRPTTGGVVS
jgi:hypothetical protein